MSIQIKCSKFVDFLEKNRFYCNTSGFTHNRFIKHTFALCVLWSWENTPRARGCVVPGLTVTALRCFGIKVTQKGRFWGYSVSLCYLSTSICASCNINTLEKEYTLCTQQGDLQDVNLSYASILVLYNLNISMGTFSILPSPPNKTEVLYRFLFSFWLHLLPFHCYSCQTHFWNHKQQWETWNFKFSCWYVWSYGRFCGKSWKQSHAKLFEKQSHGWWLADVFPWPWI